MTRRAPGELPAVERTFFGLPNEFGDVMDLRVAKGWKGSIQFPGFRMVGEIMDGSAELIQTDKGIFIKVDRL